MKDAIGNVQRVLVLGGTSDIALATVIKLTEQRRDVLVTLAARPGERRSAAATELESLGLRVTEVDFDATDRSSYEKAVTLAFDDGGDIDVVIVAFGLLGEQARAWREVDAALDLVQVNYAAAVACGVLVVQLCLRLHQGRAGRLLHRAGRRARGGRHTGHGCPPWFRPEQDDGGAQGGAAVPDAGTGCRPDCGWPAGRTAHRMGATGDALGHVGSATPSPSGVQPSAHLRTQG